MEKELDFIITTYNSCDTLGSTLESIISQKNIPNYSIYIVDDCSEDDYSNLLELYKDKADIHFCKTNENMGPGYARNIGLDLSDSKYVIFIDSDDVFYDDNSISYLYEAIVKNNSHLVTSNIKEEVADGYKDYKNELIGVHGKIYDKKYLEDNCIHFPNTRSNEDYAFNSKIRLGNSKIFNIDDTTYIWKYNKNSLTRKKSNDNYNKDCIYFIKNSYDVIIFALKNNYDLDKIVLYMLEVVISFYYKINYVIGQLIYNEAIKYFNMILDIYGRLCDVPIYENICRHDMVSDNNKDDLLSFIINNSLGKRLYTDYQRKQLGLFFHPLDDILGEEKEKHINLMHVFNKYNRFDFTNLDMINILKNMFGYYDSSSIIEPPVYSTWGCKNVYLGQNCYLNFNITFVDDGDIIIGNNVMISPGVHIITVSHPMSSKARRNTLLKVKDVHINDNVWIAEGVTILPGVTIGEGSVIGAGSVVTTDIPSNVFAAGNPCKVIRKLNNYDNLIL